MIYGSGRSSLIPYTQRCAKVKQLSVAVLFADAIRRVIDNKSISDLYIVKA